MAGRLVIATVIAVALLGAPATSAGPTPDGTRICPAAPSDGGAPLDTRRLKGKPLLRAMRMGRRHDCEVRMVKLDGAWLPVTTDYRLDRVNISVRDGHVKRVFGVY
jgi:hypothetical protein